MTKKMVNKHVNKVCERLLTELSTTYPYGYAQDIHNRVIGQGGGWRKLFDQNGLAWLTALRNVPWWALAATRSLSENGLIVGTLSLAVRDGLLPGTEKKEDDK